MQRAHDMLVGILLEDVPTDVSPEVRRVLMVSADVLCWVLEHPYNARFGALLELIERSVRTAGYGLADHGHPN